MGANALGTYHWFGLFFLEFTCHQALFHGSIPLSLKLAPPHRVETNMAARVLDGGSGMRSRLLIGLMGLMLVGFSTPAMAQEEPTDEGEVHSKIEGQLVPVGEKNKYEYAYKRHLVSSNPLAWFLGSFTVGYTFAFHKYVGVRVDAGFYHIWKTDLYGGQLSASVPIYFKKMHDGFYLEPGVFGMVLDYRGDTITAGGPQLLLGWSWIWDSGFNINLGLGMTYTWMSGDVEGGFMSVDGPLPTGRLAFGYAW